MCGLIQLEPRNVFKFEWFMISAAIKLSSLPPFWVDLLQNGATTLSKMTLSLMAFSITISII
jgi:hypothetical protein